MDDQGLAWPAWKFGMKRDDLFTTLHDRYNTFSCSLQDPEAFHHDVYEASRDADTAEEFHRLMADRKRQRVEELHVSLESLAVEIIANPDLMASDQWQYALQLFRTKSFDSIVRFFGSYIPDNAYDQSDKSTAPPSPYYTSSEACSADDALYSSTTDDESFHLEVFDEEPTPNAQAKSMDVVYDGPLSPPQSEAESELSSGTGSSATYESITNPPSRSMSFSGSESGHMGPGLIHSTFTRDEDETSQSDDCDTAVTSVCDSSECRSAIDPAEQEPLFHVVASDEEDDIPTTQFPDDDFNTLDSCDSFNDTLDSETATPKAEPFSTCYVDYKSVLSRRLSSPSHNRAPSPKSSLSHRRDNSPLREVRRSPEESLSKIQKPLMDAGRRRPKMRTRLD